MIYQQYFCVFVFINFSKCKDFFARYAALKDREAAKA
jgi:hypothetical protein